MRKVLYSVLVVWIFVQTASASLIFIPTDYGLSAELSALANAGAALGGGAFGSFYNPALLAYSPEDEERASELGFGYLFAAPQFEGGLKGNTNEFTESNQTVIVGLNLALDSLLANPHPLSFGLTLAADDNMNAFVHFTDRRTDEGEFQRYGIASVAISAGLGGKIYGPLYLGAGALVGIQASTKMSVRTTMAGETSEAQIEMDASPSMAPIAGVGLGWDKLNVGLVYRGKLVGRVGPIEAPATAIVGGSEMATIPLKLYFKDGYVPQQVALGILWNISEMFSVVLEADWLNWADFAREVETKDAAREDIELETKDLFVPRVGFEIDPTDYLAVRLGYRFEDTPFVKNGGGTNVVLDNARHVASLGLGLNVDKPPLLAKPLSFDLTYFLMYLVPREFESSDGREFESSGMLHGVVGTCTVRF